MNRDAMLSRLLLENIQPPRGRQGWHGGPTPLGSLRGVAVEQAAWKPGPRRHSIWQLALHIAYWKYAVRRRLTGGKGNAFDRGPANWPSVADPADERAWAADRALLRHEHELLLDAVAAVPVAHLGRHLPGSKKWTYGELILGIAQHDAYHAGQIQLMRRLWREREAYSRGGAT
jgi:uncharacterized damage-inducible protein DinB